MRVQLIQPSTGEYRSNSRSGCYPPLGLLSIATYVRQECPDIEVEILDGELIPDEAIISRLDADIVGINANTITYPRAIQIAEAAKERGSKVVLGGVYASAVPDLILRHRGHLIDSVVIGYGEQPMVDLIRGRSEKLVVNYKPEFDRLPPPDRNLINLASYLDRFHRCRPTWPYRGSSLFSNVGCNWREKSRGGCIFCSRSGRMVAKKQPAVIWQEVRDLVEKYEVDYVADFSDTSLQDKDWLKAIIHAKPEDLNPNRLIFARIDEITPETLRLLKALPCKQLFVGIESGDTKGYRASRKGGGSPEASIRMGHLLGEYEIELSPSYVIGLPGETKESLKRTYDHACRLKELTGFEEIICSELIPFPGCAAFNVVRRKAAFDTDVFDAEDLKRLWVEHACSVDFDLMELYVSKILDLGKYKITISKKIKSEWPIAISGYDFLTSGFAEGMEQSCAEVYECV